MSRRLHYPLRRTRRWAFGLAVALTAGMGLAMMTATVQAQGITALEVGILILFAPTFTWITVAFWNAVVGFALVLLDRDPLTLERRAGDSQGKGALRFRTAVVMPAHHEDPDRLARGLGAMARSLARTGQGNAFDLWLLSDTTDEGAGRVEEEVWAGLRAELEGLDGAPGLYYRRRRVNEGRKAGNIEEFCRRWGGRYEAMAVLDADSVMTGPALVELVRTLEANPDVGLVQSVPLPARQDTLFGRILQFAAALYSPMLAAGQAFWQLDTGNYWGHNAVLRMEAFTRHAHLPVLPGRPPLGGPILSHDFVEAALLRRGGWRAVLRPRTGGSWEEVPGNVVDYAQRDRRWAQGSIQHLRLLRARGLHPLSRLHFLLGAMGYLASVLWLGVLLAGTVYVAVPSASDRVLLPQGLPWLAPAGGLDGLLPLLAITAVLLFLPKALGLLLALRDAGQGWGGRLRVAAGGVLELLFSVVLAPVMMLFHAAFVLQILVGRDVRWAPQPRDGRRVGWGEAFRRTAGVTAVGVAWAGVTLWVSPLFFLWLLPIFLGQVLAAPLVRWSSSARLGRVTRRLGLFLVPWEAATPPELREDGPTMPDTDLEVAAVRGGNVGREVAPREDRLSMPDQVLHPTEGPELSHRPT